MEKRNVFVTIILWLLVYSAQLAIAAPMGTAFTYQGQLYDYNYPANDQYDFQFKLYDANSSGNQIGDDVNVANLDIIKGYFTVTELDFNDANAFNGNARWLEIGIRPGDQNDPCSYTVLSPRQKVTPTPHAVYAETSGSVKGGIWHHSGTEVYYNETAPAGTWTDVNTNDVVGSNYALVFLKVNFLPGGWGQQISFRPNGESDDTVTQGGSGCAAVGLYGPPAAGFVIVETGADGKVEFKMPSAMGIKITLYGYVK